MTTVSSTIEGRPSIQYDWEAEYRKQIRNRLADVISEYHQDEQLSILSFYQDLTDELKSLANYHSEQKNKAEGMLALINGGRNFE